MEAGPTRQKDPGPPPEEDYKGPVFRSENETVQQSINRHGEHVTNSFYYLILCQNTKFYSLQNQI